MPCLLTAISLLSNHLSCSFLVFLKIHTKDNIIPRYDMRRCSFNKPSSYLLSVLLLWPAHTLTRYHRCTYIQHSKSPLLGLVLLKIIFEYGTCSCAVRVIHPNWLLIFTDKFLCKFIINEEADIIKVLFHKLILC